MPFHLKYIKISFKNCKLTLNEAYFICKQILFLNYLKCDLFTFFNSK